MVQGADIARGYIGAATDTSSVNDHSAGGGRGSLVLMATVAISSADLLALNTVRKQVLAAPGDGFVRLVLWTAYRMVPGATPYTIDPSEGIAMRYGAGSATAGPFLDGEVILAATAPFLSTMIGTGYGDLLSAFENQPITVLATGPITAGDGHLVLTMGYQDVPVA